MMRGPLNAVLDPVALWYCRLSVWEPCVRPSSTLKFPQVPSNPDPHEASICGGGDPNTTPSIFGIALVHVPLCSFNAVSTVFVWAITTAGFSVWMKCPHRCCDLLATTLFRALRHLRVEGLLEFQRGRGISVSGDAPGLNEVVARCRDLLGFSSRHGYRKEEVLKIIEGLS